MEGREMKTATEANRTSVPPVKFPEKGKHLLAFAAVTFEKVNSACALKLRAQPV